MTIPIHKAIIGAAILIILGTAAWFYQEAKYNSLIDQMKESLEEEKKTALQRQQKLIQERDQTINELQTENEKAKAQSNYWRQEAKRRGRNPDYNIDFITAADEIAKSRYRPGQ